jgi:sugar phosphate isomerase/epimerase
MHLTGFADEAGAEPEAQIEANRRLGWTCIEARRMGSANIHDIGDAEFDRAAGLLADAGMRVDCFGSAIANWGKQIDPPADSSLAEARRAIPRMRRLGTRLIRIMSFAVRRDASGRALDDQAEAERFRRLRELTALFLDAGIQPVHENCMNWGGMGASFSLRLLDAVPGLKLVFDTGNPSASDDHDVPARSDGTRPKQSSWDFYRRVRQHIVHVHIKDAVFDPVGGTHVHTWPGDGQGDVRAIVRDLLATGYDGAFSMEPHIAVIAHDPSVTAPAEARIQTYVTYGRRFERLLADCRQDLPQRAAAAG